MNPAPDTSGRASSQPHDWSFVGVQAGPDQPAGTRGAPMVLAICSRCGRVRSSGPEPARGRWHIDLSGDCPVPQEQAPEEEAPDEELPFLRDP